MAELGARFGFSFNVVGQLTAPASARSADSKNSTQRHKIDLSIVLHSRRSASPREQTCSIIAGRTSAILDWPRRRERRDVARRPAPPPQSWLDEGASLRALHAFAVLIRNRGRKGPGARGASSRDV